ncbi:MAG: hypothetical protein FJ104_10810, partial [Deltaproteobacteria bacterium]|nr:hypothetical protein [Deltaproteobacteria bacterium]
PDDGAPTCARDGTCDGASSCRYYPSAACTPRPCTTGRDCASGSCADGICCDRSCTGTCEACTATLKGSGSDGTCEAIATGTDPEDECPSAGSGSCAGDGSCDGAGSCELSTTGESCAAATCSGPATLSLAASCDRAGSCSPTEVDCTPYGCDSANVACRVRCSTSSECAPGATCAGGVCERAGAGSPCSSGSDCDSGYCVDDVCCSTYCDGQCEACDLPGEEGTCSAVTGAPRGSRSPCRGSGDCAGSCDGSVRSACAYPTETTPCGSSATCEDGVERADSCNGVGDCSLGATRSCAPFACDGTRCASTCSTDGDCVTGYRCDSSGACVDENSPFCNELGSVEYPSGQTERCAPFGCENGACLTRCASDDECHTSAHCSERTEQCLFSSDDSGCGCRAAGGGRPAGPPAALAALLIGLLAARRAPRRTPRRTR